MVAIFSVLAFMSASLFVFGLLSVLTSEDRQVRKVLNRITDYEAAELGVAEPLAQPFLQRVLWPAARSLVHLGRSALPSDYRQRLRDRLIRAGNPGGLDADRFLALKFIGVIAAVAIAVGWVFVGSFSIRRFLLVLVVLEAANWFGLDLWLSSAVSRRKTAIRRALPDMLDMLSISVQAGLGFDAALAKLVKNSSGPLAQEFARMLQEVQAGRPRRDALKELSERADVPELTAFIMSMLQAEVFGVSVNSILKTQAREMRVKRRQQAEEEAQKAPVKMVFPVVLCILPVTIMVIAGPAVVAIGGAIQLMNR